MLVTWEDTSLTLKKQRRGKLPRKESILSRCNNILAKTRQCFELDSVFYIMADGEEAGDLTFSAWAVPSVHGLRSEAERVVGRSWKVRSHKEPYWPRVPDVSIRVLWKAFNGQCKCLENAGALGTEERGVCFLSNPTIVSVCLSPSTAWVLGSCLVLSITTCFSYWSGVNVRQVKCLLRPQAGKEMGHLLVTCPVTMQMTFPNRFVLILRKSLIYVINVELSG